MLAKLKTIIRMWQILKSGENIGDAAVLKMTLFAENEGESQYRDLALAQKASNFFPIHPEQLATLPKNTFGYAYCQFMKENALTPFNLSERVEPNFDKFPVTIRYVRLHDMFHVLLGFDTSVAGELGVYAFIGEQHYTKKLDWASRVAKSFEFIMFWKRKTLNAAKKRGQRLAQNAEVIVTLPLEDMFDRDLDTLRRELIPNLDI